MLRPKIARAVIVTLAVGALGLGCSSKADLVPAPTATTSSSEQGTDEESGDESESGSEGTEPEPEPDLPLEDLCECEPGSLCVADCEPGGEWSNYLDDFRCVGPPACSDDPDDPECLIEACGYSVATLADCEGETQGADIICIPDYEWLYLCRALQQDCPESEKCVLQVLGWEQLHTGQCVPFEEPGAAVGEDCSSEGVTTGIDDCDASSMCWKGEVSSEPFVGTCHGFCTLEEGQPTCPEGSACEMIGTEDFYLCVPA